MKKSALVYVAILSIGVAHADLLVAKGAKATVTAEYSYAAAGVKKDKYDPREWKVTRTVNVTAQFAADKPQALAQLRAPEAAQTADLQKKQALAQSASKKMTPMMGDMMKIVEKCGENEACIEKEVEAYGNSMQMTPELKSAGEDIDKLGKTDGPRYQLWKAVSQKGTYFVDEFYKGQTADPACMEKPKQRCHRQETRKGGGDFASPPGRVNASGAMFEVDARKKDIVMTLPMPMMPLTYNREVMSDFPDEASGSSQGIMQMTLGSAAKPMTVTIPGDLKTLSGTQQVKVDGVEGEGGTVTVRWTLAVQ
jgi:hypothetical protein